METQMGRYVLAAFALTVLAACKNGEPMSQSSHPLVGTWKLVEWRSQDSLGVWHEQFGSEPRGYFVYGESGHLSIHLMHEDGADVDGCDPSLATRFAAEDLLVLTECYAGYFGRYRIEPGDSVVVHLPEGGTILSLIGTEQPRYFEVRGDSLWIERSETVHRLLLRVD
jgi:hypothetical protein